MGAGAVAQAGYRAMKGLAEAFPGTLDRRQLVAVRGGDPIRSLDDTRLVMPDLRRVWCKPGRKGRGNPGRYGLKWPE